MKVILSDFREELPVQAIEEYCKLTGQNCYFYDQTSDIVFYKKRKKGKPKYGMHVVTEDLGSITTFDKIIKHIFPFTLFPVDEEERKKTRTDPLLIELVEKYGDGMYLRVIEIPDDVDWYIEFDEGCEYVAEKHRTWWK